MEIKDNNIKEAESPKFTKKQIVNSKTYRRNRDVLNAILNENISYSIKDIDRLILKFMKGKVK